MTYQLPLSLLLELAKQAKALQHPAAASAELATPADPIAMPTPAHQTKRPAEFGHLATVTPITANADR